MYFDWNWASLCSVGGRRDETIIEREKRWGGCGRWWWWWPSNRFQTSALCTSKRILSLSLWIALSITYICKYDGEHDQSRLCYTSLYVFLLVKNIALKMQNIGKLSAFWLIEIIDRFKKQILVGWNVLGVRRCTSYREKERVASRASKCQIHTHTILYAPLPPIIVIDFPLPHPPTVYPLRQ